MKIRVKKRIKMIGIILLSFFLLISLGCKDQKVKKKARKYLRETYDKKFVIKKVRHIQANKSWELTAAPKENKDLEFKVRTGGGIFGEEVYSGYAKIKFTMQSRKYFKPILKDIFDKEVYFYSNVGTYANYDPKNLPDFKKLLQKNSDSTYVNFFIHIFENVVTSPERKQKFLKNVMELLEYMREQNLKWGTITISIYDEEFYEDKDIDYILKETNFFHRGSRKLDHNAMEFKSYIRYGMGISKKEYFKIQTLEDLEQELNKADMEFLRE